MKYQVIYADPPWQWTKKPLENRGRARAVEKEYPTMSPEDLCALPVSGIAADNSVLLLWATWPKMIIALKLMDAWGFQYKTCGFLWAKENRKSPGWFTGMGFYTRANTEPCLLGVRGAGIQRQSRSVRQLLVSPVSLHSKKPDEARTRIVALFGNVPRVELFARQKADGWDSWGNEVNSDLNLMSL